MTERRHTVSWRVNAERIVLLGWSRAILLQLAHPLVAAGVAEHSSFRGGPFAAAARLHHTVRAMLALTFGSGAQRGAALDGIRAIHRRVHGHLPAAAGIFPAGTPYSAEDPDLVLWVHATLLESIPIIYERVVAPLTAAERNAYCDEAAAVAIELGARVREVPRTVPELSAYLDRMYASGVIAVSDQARSLAAAVIAPPFSYVIAPVAAMNRLITIGLLPEHVRREYDARWEAASEARLETILSGINRLHGLLPRRIAWWTSAI